MYPVCRPDFDTSTLNGLRPLDQAPLALWAGRRHRSRMERLLEELPELPRALIELRYEEDCGWIERWHCDSCRPVVCAG